MNSATSLRPWWLPQHFAPSVTCVTDFSVSDGYADCGEISVKREIKTIYRGAVTSFPIGAGSSNNQGIQALRSVIE